MTLRRPFAVALVLAALAAGSGAHAAGKPLIGISFSVETDGFFSTTLKKVTITEVKPGAPAAQAGLQVGDDVVAANDLPIAGTPGSKLSAMIGAAKPGDHLRLRVQRGGAEQQVDIVVGER